MNRHALLPELESSHLDEILSYLRDTLLALVDGEIWPMDQFLVDLRLEL